MLRVSRAVHAHNLGATKPCFEDLNPVHKAVDRLANEGSVEERGAIYTKRNVVEFILDLVGYTVDKPLADYRLLEPSFGDGDFILPTLERLLTSAKRERNGLSRERLTTAIRGVELHRETFESNRASMHSLMLSHGISSSESDALLDDWLTQGDFLLCDFDQTFTHAVGNPPYLRQETIPDILIEEYRKRFATIYDRADIYVPFIEHSLSLLSIGGKLGFICADRWMKNRYGKKLRELVSKKFALTMYVDMVNTDAFHSEVSAYPAITVIESRHELDRKTPTRVCARPNICKKSLRALSKELTAKTINRKTTITEIENIVSGSEPWILDDFKALALVRRLEANFPLLEEAGCKVGIGVATGADKAFIGVFDELDVEPDRKLPLIMTKDIRSESVSWQGRGVINPFGDDGKLVKLEDFPRLRNHLENKRELIAGRHVAMKAPHNWYRTIDKINPELAKREKLLIPDIKGDASIIHEKGKFYPHHNLYYIVSDEWELCALRTVMRSGIARLFVSLYSTKMRGGYLRFQAQYLRRIRLPRWETISNKTKQRLAVVCDKSDQQEINEIVASLYGLSSLEMKIIKGQSAG